ncbi:MAG: hypothetical protein GQ574_25425 [Crocinitomix sp.]|nr:hypothetical protein [Crocinitomix sp.]
MKKILSLIAFLVSITVNAQTDYPGSEIIGMGYDVFGEFANNRSVKYYPLFDFSKAQIKDNTYGHAFPKFVRIDNMSDHVVKTVEGSSESEYITHLSEEVGLSGGAFFFKASVENQFGSSSNALTNSFYYTYIDINTKWRITLDTRNKDTLIHYLDAQFKLDLANLPPKELFETYGTHFISKAYLGGRIDYSTVSQLTETVTQTDAKTALSAKYMYISGNVSVDEQSESILSQIRTTENLNVIGGNSEFANNIHDYEQYQKWAEGIKERPVLSGFDNKSLEPIWNLTKDETRKKQLKDYYNEHILPLHPIPVNHKFDPILDNTSFTQNFRITFLEFLIHQDCDNYVLTGDEAGDFVYSISIYVNNELIHTLGTKEGYINRIWSGESLSINKYLDVSVPINSESSIAIKITLREEDALENEYLANGKVVRHRTPFAITDLYNVKDDDILFWQESLRKASDCNATLSYQVLQRPNETAVDFGNKGWEEYELGNYDKSLYYSKEALKLDNALWYIHYNVALVYLIQENPNAFERYKLISEYCGDKEAIQAALDDIKSHELNIGKLTNSEPVKLYLESKF